MSHLLREHAPITEQTWGLIDDEARERLTPALAGRKLVDFRGPRGWEFAATNLGPDAYTNVLETSEHGGYPLLEHLRKIVGGPLVWSPGVDGAVVVSERGGDFILEVGEDLAIGYENHGSESVELYLVETFTFHV